jgi:hypothetical protein
MHEAYSRPGHSQQLARQRTLLADRLVDALGLPAEIRVKGADDDAGVGGPRAVEPNEVKPIEREDRAILLCCERQDFGIRPGLVRFSRLVNREHIVTQRTQVLPPLAGENSRWNTTAPSIGFVRLDLPVDLFTMGPNEPSGVGKIFRPKRWIGPQQFRF